MVEIQTHISSGYKDLLKVFFEANELDVSLDNPAGKHTHGHIVISYEDNSETVYCITAMSVKHCGFENMLHHFLIRCGVDPHLISIGQSSKSRNMADLEKQWLDHKLKIGL